MQPLLRSLPALLLLPLLISCTQFRHHNRPITLVRGEDGHHRFKVAHNLPKDQLPSLTPASNNDLFKVFVAQSGKAIAPDQPALIGELTTEPGHFLFQPGYPLQPGLTYQAIYNPPPGSTAATSRPIQESFSLPPPPRTRSTVVTGVYPTTSTLPENQLKFYIHFSDSMSRGQAAQHVRLLQSDGREVELPFLILDEELWNHAGDRLTLLFDPGRVKRELRPREESGPALEQGRRYTLVIDSLWTDSHGNRLKRTFRKRFKVVGPDYVSPSITNWIVHPPTPSSREPLVIDFPEPLDHALLNRLLWIATPNDTPFPGTVRISKNETRWSFLPDSDWPTTPLDLLVRNTLEDLAGNSVGQPFERHFDGSSPPSGSAVSRLPIFK